MSMIRVTRRWTTRLALASALTATTAITAGAQRPKGFARDEVPPGHQPPPGMCRVWIDGVPPGRQPAPTDCATAMRNRPQNGRVLFGDDDKRRRDSEDRAREEARGEDRDDAARQPQSMPQMSAGLTLGQGDRSGDVVRWLGKGELTSRIVDSDRDGRPERVTWFDATGRMLQVWTDNDRDGRADRVEIFENGRRVRVVPH